jgi:hypothetical protein
VLGWPKRCQLAHAFLREYSYKRLKSAQLLDQLGVFPHVCGRAQVGNVTSADRPAAEMCRVLPDTTFVAPQFRQPGDPLASAVMLGLGRIAALRYRSSI